MAKASINNPKHRSYSANVIAAARDLLRTPKYQPLFDNVLVKPLEPETKTASGILLPDTVKEKPQVGQVMATGPGTTDDKGNKIPVQVKVGQKVLYKKWGGNEVKVGAEEWMILEQKDILAVVEN